MRNIILPLTILALLITLVLFNLSFLKSSTNELTELLTKAKTAAESGDFSECRQYISDFEKRYEDFDGIYTIVIRHIEMDEIQKCTQKAAEYANTNEKGLVMAELSTLQALVKHLYEIEQINFYNIV